MYVLAILVLAAIVFILLVSAPFDGTRQRGLVSARNLVICSFVVYYVFPAMLIALNSLRFTWAPSYGSEQTLVRCLLVASLALGVFALSFRIAAAGRVSDLSGNGEEVERSGGSVAFAERWGRADRLAVALVVAGLLLKIYLLVSTGGLTDSLLRISGTARSVSGVADVSTAAIAARSLSGIADVGCVWLVARALKLNRMLLTSSVLAIVVLSLSFVTSGKRLTLLLPLLVVVVAIHRYRRPIKVQHAPIALVGMFGVGMATLLFRIFAPANAAGIELNIADAGYGDGSLLGFYAYSLEFSTVDMTAVALESGDSIRAGFGGAFDAFITTSVVPLLYVVPRGIFPWKPDAFYDISYGITAVLNSSSYQYSDAGYASTAVGTSIIYGGLPALVVAFAILGLLCERIDRVVQRRQLSTQSLIVYAVLLNFVFHAFRQGTLGWAFIVAVVQQLGFIIGLTMLAVAAAQPKHSPSQVATRDMT